MLLAVVFVLGVVSAHADTVVIPEPTNPGFDYFGQGDASVTYGGVVFTQQNSLGNAYLYNVGSSFSGVPAVLSSQQQTEGVANILISFAGNGTLFSVDFGTFDGSNVTFSFSNGQTFTQGSSGSSSGSGYATANNFSYSGAAFNSVEITSPDFVLSINNVSSNTSAVPEPGTLTLLGTGLIGLGRTIRRRRSL